MEEYRSLHLALCSLNYDKKLNEFCSQVKKDLYSKSIDKYKEYLNEDLPDELYKPNTYVMFGSYDVCFVSLIHDFEFAQKNFYPIYNSEQDGNEFLDSKYQIITGIPKHPIKNDLLRSKKKHIAIINLKIKNGLLIGNGNNLLINIIKYLLEKLNSPDQNNKNNYQNNFVISQSFSWFELSITIFDDDLSKLFNTIASLRNIKLKDIFSDEKDLEAIIKDSYYNDVTDTDKERLDDYKDKNIFSDTQSHLGIEKDYIDSIKPDKKDQINVSTPKDLSFLFEWQIKPGSFLKLKKILDGKFPDDEKAASQPIKHQIYRHFVSGKYDYISNIVEENGLVNFIQLYQLLQDDSDFRDIVRQIKSRPLIDTTDWNCDKEVPSYSKSITEKLKQFLISDKDILKIDENLKSLKLSRLLRKKIIKIFENYNNAIVEPVLFTFFIDFCIFICKLKYVIEKYAEDALKEPTKVNDITLKLEEFINAFEDGYQARYLNSYNYEEINTFDLDFNSSIEQLLTAYNTLLTKLSRQFYKLEDCCKLVLFNLNVTHSTGNYANFFINHLLNPEFIYVTITKEILNNYMSIVDQNDEFKKNYDTLVQKITKSKLNPFFNNINEKDSPLEVFKYLVADYVYFESILITSENNPIEAFEKHNYWFWNHTLQNSQLYNTDGILNQRDFQTQLIRMMILGWLTLKKDNFAKALTIIKDSLLPELHSYWERYNVTFTDIIKQSEDELRHVYTFIKLFMAKKSAINADPNPSLKEYLDIIYKKTKKNQPKLLRRNWINGETMGSFLENKNHYYYYVDPFGGAFFDNFESQKKYILLRNEELVKIWGESLVYKKELLEKEIITLFKQ